MGGESRERVYEVAGDPQSGAGLDLATCTPAPGADQLCRVWTDPDFDPRAPAFYYARVVENPSCRWNTWACNAHQVDCAHPGQRPARALRVLRRRRAEVDPGTRVDLADLVFTGGGGEDSAGGVKMALFDFLTGGQPTVEVGQKAPDFELPDAHGKPVRLADFRGKRAVVLYFYPKDDTPGCTAEACSFRDSYEDFQQAGAEVIGVSSDSESSHDRFASRHRLPFTLLADARGEVRKKYGVPATFGLLPGRVTFVIDRKGIVRHVFNSQLQATRHVEEALAALAAE